MQPQQTMLGLTFHGARINPHHESNLQNETYNKTSRAKHLLIIITSSWESSIGDNQNTCQKIRIYCFPAPLWQHTRKRSDAVSSKDTLQIIHSKNDLCSPSLLPCKVWNWQFSFVFFFSFSHSYKGGGIVYKDFPLQVVRDGDNCIRVDWMLGVLFIPSHNKTK